MADNNSNRKGIQSESGRCNSSNQENDSRRRNADAKVSHDIGPGDAPDSPLQIGRVNSWVESDWFRIWISLAKNKCE